MIGGSRVMAGLNVIHFMATALRGPRMKSTATGAMSGGAIWASNAFFMLSDLKNRRDAGLSNCGFRFRDIR